MKRILWTLTFIAVASLSSATVHAKYVDQESALLYYGHRYHSPSEGRWLSRDPLFELVSQRNPDRTSDSKRLASVTIMVYICLKNDTINQIDLLGLEQAPNPAERRWCKDHPLCCCRVYDSDSVTIRELQRRFNSLPDNTVVNAIQHCTWMCYVASRVLCNPSFALSLGQAHEDTAGFSTHGSAMDLFNNYVGAYMGGSSVSDCADKCTQAANNYQLYWFEPMNPTPPGLPTDFPNTTIGSGGQRTGPSPGGGVESPPTFPGGDGRTGPGHPY